MKFAYIPPKNSVLATKIFKNGTRLKYLLVIPADGDEEILKACHDEPSYGHVGTARTLGKIMAKY